MRRATSSARVKQPTAGPLRPCAVHVPEAGQHVELADEVAAVAGGGQRLLEAAGGLPVATLHPQNVPEAGSAGATEDGPAGRP